jgi:hypothetical protein
MDIKMNLYMHTHTITCAMIRQPGCGRWPQYPRTPKKEEMWSNRQKTVYSILQKHAYTHAGHTDQSPGNAKQEKYRSLLNAGVDRIVGPNFGWNLTVHFWSLGLVEAASTNQGAPPTQSCMFSQNRRWIIQELFNLWKCIDKLSF